MTETILAGAALLVALGALALAALVMRQNADAVDTLRAHRRAHAKVHGYPDPDRRGRDIGPPPGQPDRRRAPTPPRVTPPSPPRHGRDDTADQATTELPAQPPNPARRRSDLA